jgi:hypothetical protein
MANMMPSFKVWDLILFPVPSYVTEYLDRKYDFEPATGHQFFMLNMILL